MNIAFCKMGKSIKFKGSFSPIGGDNEPGAVFIALANNNPDSTFYLAGKSDYSRLSELEKNNLFPYNNVVNVYDNIPVTSIQTRADYNDPYIQCLNNFFENLHIDSVVIMMGQVGGVSLPGKTWQIRDTSLIASCIDMTANYTSPITVWLNENRMSKSKNIPIIEIINDPRYTLAQPRDIIFTPDIALSQYNYSYTNYTIKNYEEQLPKIENMVNVTYNGMEKAFLVNRQFPNNVENNRSRKFTVILNEGKPTRYNMLNEWVLDNSELQEGLEIYGKWDHPNAIKDERFKGSLQLEDVQTIMEDTRYTFIIPIKRGWVTSKYIEMIYAGVIPFFHPNYDMQGNIKLEKYNKLLRPESPEELIKAISLLERHPEIRKRIISELQRMCIKPEDLNGEAISYTIMEETARLNNTIYKKPNLNNFTKIKQPTTLESLLND